jgi:cytochrome P450 family 142 subfamily A polypeptide 1
MADSSLTAPDLLAPEFYLGDPHASYAWLRENDPIHWDPVNEFWGVFRYDDIIEIEKNKHLFISSGQHENGYRPKMAADPSIIGLDDPNHLVRRNLVSRRFTPRGVQKFEHHVREVIAELFDAVEAKGGRDVEVIEELAARLPATMIGELLGFPEDMWPLLKRWSEETIALGGGPRYFDPKGIEAFGEFTQACTHLYEEKKGCPADDVMSVWVETERTGLPDQEFGLAQILSDCLLLLDGGAETTRTVIGWTILNLIDHPEEWAKLKDGADMTVATEEFIRWVTPIHNMCRSAARDTVLHGKEIKAGDQLVLFYPSANRDPLHFDRPDVFDVTRTPNNHIAFGFGTHFCLGASLARLEIRLFFEELVRRVDRIERVEGAPFRRLGNAFVAGLLEAHVNLDLR